MTTRHDADLLASDSTTRPSSRLSEFFTLNGTLWIFQVLWGFFFAGSGFGKVLLIDDALYATAPRAVAWYAAVPQPLIVFIGVVELLGGIGLILPALTRVTPKLTPLAGAGLALTMVLAAAFHIARGEYELVPTTVVLGGVSAFLTVGRWKLRPVQNEPVRTGRVLVAAGVLVAMAVLVLAPTWYTMTHVQF